VLLPDSLHQSIWYVVRDVAAFPGMVDSHIRAGNLDQGGIDFS
jgi:hypothetical protein